MTRSTKRVVSKATASPPETVAERSFGTPASRTRTALRNGIWLNNVLALTGRPESLRRREHPRAPGTLRRRRGRGRGLNAVLGRLLELKLTTCLWGTCAAKKFSLVGCLAERPSFLVRFGGQPWRAVPRAVSGWRQSAGESASSTVPYDTGSTMSRSSSGGHVQIRSSITHPLQIAEIATRGGGCIGVTFCPGKCGRSLFGHMWKRDLEADLDIIERWGARVVLTLVEDSELEALQVAGLGERVRGRGMRWLHLPIVDVSVPSSDFESQWRQELPELLATLEQGAKVLVHCKGGLGRAGMVAAFLLIESGEPHDVAIQKVRQVRPGAIETAAQESYVAGYQPRGAAL